MFTYGLKKKISKYVWLENISVGPTALWEMRENNVKKRHYTLIYFKNTRGSGKGLYRGLRDIRHLAKNTRHIF
ncbi:MAG: hypothetical protein DBY24_10660 [Prevotellaceae bacterium]|nr:MAG: hypothetical protein DBY24_10660 [Prevotellaceae bacterium]